MAAWDSPYLLNLFNRYSGRAQGGATDTISTADKYDRLAIANQEVLLAISSIIPRFLYGAPTAMSTADGGFTYTFGTDGDGAPNTPLGKAQVFPSLNAVPNFPWLEGIDYLDEGTRIRMPNNQQWTAPLYWYGMTMPQDLSASVNPTLNPPSARILIPVQAVKNFAEEGNRNPPLAAAMNAKYQEHFGPIMTAMRKHFRSGGTLGQGSYPWGRAGGLYAPSGLGGW